VVRDCGNLAGKTPSCDGDDVAVYAGKLAEMTDPAPLGTYAAGEGHRYQFTILFNPAAGNAYQDDTATATFRWDAIH
jgi:hypothetical protein